MDIINLYENYNLYFNNDLKAVFEKISEIASNKGFKLYLIGGMVRDLLLDKKSLDIDITVEGDAIKFAELIQKQLGAKILSVHKSFGTAKIEVDRYRVDFASTRSESYPKAGHLPHVDKIGCDLKEDVLRRDFTINSLALSLNKDSFSDLIDYTGGFEDLKNKKIKILHDKSFIDDPTRIIRALKYSVRFGFELDDKAFELQEKYLKNINYDMCQKRVKQEIKKTFEQNSQKAFDKFIEQGIYKLVTKNSIKKPSENIAKLINIYPPKYPWLVYFGVMSILGKIELDFTKYENEVIKGAKSLLNKKFSNDFELYKAFSTQKIEALLILAALGSEKNVIHYLNDLAKIKLHISGKDLIELGISPSKKFSEVFDYVLKEKLKNPKITKAEELKITKQYFNL